MPWDNSTNLPSWKILFIFNIFKAPQKINVQDLEAEKTWYSGYVSLIPILFYCPVGDETKGEYEGNSRSTETSFAFPLTFIIYSSSSS